MHHILQYECFLVRLSPFGQFNDIQESDTIDLYTYIIEELTKLPLAYVHFIRLRVIGNRDREADKDGPCEDRESAFENLVRSYPGVRILAGGYTAELAVRDTSPREGERPLADLIAFGRRFTSNPDLVDRIRHGRSLRMYDRSTFYTNDENGYTTYTRWSPEEEIVN